MSNRKQDLKIGLMSDLHGSLIPFEEKVDVVCIAGDIVPLEIQNDMLKSISWISGKFVPWAENLNCQKVVFIGGNHDFVFQRIMKYKSQCSSYDWENEEDFAQEIIREELMLPKKVVYLQDGLFEFNHRKIYGTPWCPELRNWAFYKNSEELNEVFDKIPEGVDLLMTHAPGRYVNDTGVSLENYTLPEYGCQELTDAVIKKKPRFWACGHVHSGNHKITGFWETDVANVSIKNENYKVAYEPLVIEI